MRAYITYLSTNNYLAGVLVLKHSLDKVKSKYPLYCIITKAVNEKSILAMEKMGIKTILVDNIKISDSVRNSIKNENFTHWNNCWDKLNIFNLIQFEKIVYLDSDMIVCQNIDELFEKESTTASTDGIWIFGEERARDLNAGIMVIEPNKKTFAEIIKFINKLPNGNYQDQIILQEFFKDWKDKEQLHLSEKYNVWVSFADKYPKDIIEDVKVLHYIGKIKPFMEKAYINNELAEQYYNLYIEYLEEVKKYLPLKLSILIPQYKETNEDIKLLLDSIEIQQAIDFNDIEVVICNDGTTTLLNTDKFKDYKFNIRYYCNRKENKGVSYTRNELLNYANGEYIMYCDADDCFFNVIGLQMIIQEIKKGFDVFSSAFIEELRVDGKPAFGVKEDSRTFVHGKVLRKQYLIDNKIQWNNKLKIHEDFYFFAQCFCMTDNIRYCPEAFYLWKWNNNSVTRQDKDFFFKTYTKVIDEHTELIKELLRKKQKEPAKWYLQKYVYSFIKMMGEKRWQNKYKDKTIKRFAKYWEQFKDIFEPSKEFETTYQLSKDEFNHFIDQLEKFGNVIKYQIK